MSGRLPKSHVVERQLNTPAPGRSDKIIYSVLTPATAIQVGRIVGREKCFAISLSRPSLWWASSPWQPFPPRRELAPAHGSTGARIRRTPRLRTGPTPGGMLVAAMVIAITTVIARNGLMGIAMGIAATPTGGEPALAGARGARPLSRQGV